MSEHVRYRGPRRWRATLPIATALLCVAAAAGVVSGPVVEIDLARERLAQLEHAAARAETYREELSRFEALDGTRAIADAEQRVARLFPLDPSAIGQHAGIRLVARRHGIALSSLSFDREVDAGLETLGDRVVRRGVRLRARASVGALLDFIEGLRELGTPLLVTEAHLSRDDASSPEFDLALRFELLHATSTRAEGAPMSASEGGP